ncbi:TauD/TfdA family dioxygenase [Sorangium sp. So ce204]|uniref:TauD/TfdA family dioxygenase n=1 Tax=Sorangium sp. So ce204 TaxID=3133288 RepID=UPI003F61E887
MSPVNHVAPGPGVSLPYLVQPERDGGDLVDWLALHRASVDSALVEHGAVLLRGFRVPDEAAFQRAAGALCGALEPRYGDLVKRRSAEFVYDATVYPKDRAILFHHEGAHTPRLPSRQLFFCGRADFTGGETPIVDSRKVYRALDPDLVRLFERKGLLYVRNFIRGVDVRWQDFFRTEDRAAVEQQCREQGVEWKWKKDGTLGIATRAPAAIRHPSTGERSFCNQVLLHHVSCLDARTASALRAVLAPGDLPRNVCFGDGSPIPDEMIAEVLKVTVKTAVRFTWRLGDIALLDNLAVAHARSPFEGDRQILVAVGDVVSQASLLRAQA